MHDQENPGWVAPRIHGEFLKLGWYRGDATVQEVRWNEDLDCWQFGWVAHDWPRANGLGSAGSARFPNDSEYGIFVTRCRRRQAGVPQ